MWLNIKNSKQLLGKNLTQHTHIYTQTQRDTVETSL